VSTVGLNEGEVRRYVREQEELEKKSDTQEELELT